MAAIFSESAITGYTEDGEKVISGRDAIESQAEFAWNFIPDDGYDMPEPEIFTEDSGREIHFVYKDLGIRQILYIEKESIVMNSNIN